MKPSSSSSWYQIPIYLEARQLFDINPAKEHWLGGGFVYRNLLRLIYCWQVPDADLDVLIDTSKSGPKEPLNVPSGWTEEETAFGSPRLITSTGRQIDYIYLDKIVDLRLERMEFTVENFLTITPLTIQSISYSIEQGKLIGDWGSKPLKTKQTQFSSASEVRRQTEEDDGARVFAKQS